MAPRRATTLLALWLIVLMAWTASLAPRWTALRLFGLMERLARRVGRPRLT